MLKIRWERKALHNTFSLFKGNNENSVHFRSVVRSLRGNVFRVNLSLVVNGFFVLCAPRWGRKRFCLNCNIFAELDIASLVFNHHHLFSLEHYQTRKKLKLHIGVYL